MHKRNGFTIVELLIVIVVIAILAAISFVVYNGVRERAVNTQLIALVDGYEKALRAYKVNHEIYPAAGTDSGMACLGSPSDYPAENGFTAGECLPGVAQASPALNTELAKDTSGLTMRPNNIVALGEERVRGVLYQRYESQDEAMVIYFQAGDKKCGRGTKDGDIPGATRCVIELQ